MLAQLVLLLVLGGPADVDETQRIVVHLRSAHTALTQAHPLLAPDQQRRRRTALARLERYIERGEFPRRTSDPYPGRRPRFIDDRGVHCAVGHLIAESDPALARAINAAHEYDYVPDIREPRLLEWVATHGFTVAELAAIQPEYGPSPPPTSESIERDLLASTETMALACPGKRTGTTSVDVHVSADKKARIQVTTSSTDAFARCIAREATRHADRRVDLENMSPPPQPFELDLTLAIDTPQAILERRFASTEDLDTYCTPRPGAIPERATVTLKTTTDGLTATVATSPANGEIERCIEDRARRWFADFGRIPDLSARREIAIVSRFATAKFRNELQMDGLSITMSCFAGKQPTVTTKLTVTAKQDAPAFTVALATRNKTVAACVRDKLSAYLTQRYTVSRPISDTKNEAYFRIDADVKVTVPIILTAGQR